MTLVSLGLGVVIAWWCCCSGCGRRCWRRLQEGRRLVDQIGWAIILPQMLASLGAVFAAWPGLVRSSAGWPAG